MLVPFIHAFPPHTPTLRLGDTTRSSGWFGRRSSAGSGGKEPGSILSKAPAHPATPHHHHHHPSGWVVCACGTAGRGITGMAGRQAGRQAVSVGVRTEGGGVGRVPQLLHATNTHMACPSSINRQPASQLLGGAWRWLGAVTNPLARSDHRCCRHCCCLPASRALSTYLSTSLPTHLPAA